MHFSSKFTTFGFQCSSARFLTAEALHVPAFIDVKRARGISFIM